MAVFFLTETTIDLDAEGNVFAEDSLENFKKRLIGIPRILARNVLGETLIVSLGDSMGAALLRFKDLRDAVMHPRVGEPLPRVTKTELREAVDAVVSDPVGALAQLQLGRALAFSGDRIKAQSAYKDFLTLWKDADRDIPILKQAKAEYARLR